MCVFRRRSAVLHLVAGWPPGLDADVQQHRFERLGFFASPSLALAAASHRYLHVSAPRESMVVAGLTVAATAAAGLVGLRAYEKYAASSPPPAATDASAPPADIPSAGSDAPSKGASAGSADGSAAGGSSSGGGAAEGASRPSGADAASAAKGARPTATSTGSMFGAQAFARRFYKGGFEDKMSRREASLILGVR